MERRNINHKRNLQGMETTKERRTGKSRRNICRRNVKHSWGNHLRTKRSAHHRQNTNRSEKACFKTQNKNLRIRRKKECTQLKTEEFTSWFKTARNRNTEVISGFTYRNANGCEWRISKKSVTSYDMPKREKSRHSRMVTYYLTMANQTPRRTPNENRR